MKRYCRRSGWSFQAIDLRWGISNEAALDKSTMRICRAEIARCQAVTPRPNFIVLLGDRHGWRPLPDGATHALFEPLELVAKLAALVPPPRFNLVRYNGVLAPAARSSTSGNRDCFFRNGPQALRKGSWFGRGCRSVEPAV